MRTTLTRAQLTAILAKHFDGINFAMYHVEGDGCLEGVTVDHPYSTEIPDDSDWREDDEPPACQEETGCATSGGARF